MNYNKITLSLSENYVKHWTIYDALRELYQNAFDRAAEDTDSPWYMEVRKIENKFNLKLGNRNTILERKTLILGETTKAENKKTIGKFGEGYKLAILVLLRNNIEVSIYTGSEEWIFALEYNEQFETKMLTVNICPLESYYQETVFEVTGIPNKVWAAYSQYNLQLQEGYDCIRTERCEVLLEKRNLNKIFIGGLYVCPYEGTSLYGYNFDPEVFPLGRDRKIVSGFDANWEASKALVEASVENIDLMNAVVNNHDTEDTNFLANFMASSEALANAMWDAFITKFTNGFPVESEFERERMTKKFKNKAFIVVDYKEYRILRQCEQYTTAFSELEAIPPKPEPTEVLNTFYDNHYDDMSEDLRIAYASELMVPAVHWKNEE